jgi:hypothetical protein
MPELIKDTVTKTLFDLGSFEEITLVKPVEFMPPADVNEALSRLGGDTSKLMSVIADGMLTEYKNTLRRTADGWHTFKEDSDGEPTSEINGEFTGQVADMKKVNNLKLSLAKSVFGFEKSMSKEAKRAAKESAAEMIKNTPAIREGLAKTAALAEAE